MTCTHSQPGWVGEVKVSELRYVLRVTKSRSFEKVYLDQTALPIAGSYHQIFPISLSVPNIHMHKIGYG